MKPVPPVTRTLAKGCLCPSPPLKLGDQHAGEASPSLRSGGVNDVVILGPRVLPSPELPETEGHVAVTFAHYEASKEALDRCAVPTCLVARLIGAAPLPPGDTEHVEEHLGPVAREAD